MAKINFRISLCNEVLSNHSFAMQCKLAAELGYDGLEIAPFTLTKDPFNLSAQKAKALRKVARNYGIEITGLHWLLSQPPGLSITTPDPQLRGRTISLLQHLVNICVELGGSVLVHGSPEQRSVGNNQSLADALARATEVWQIVAEAAEKAGITYCIEPLSANQTPILNTIAEAVAIIETIRNPAIKTMLDTSSASVTEQKSPAALLEQWGSTGLIAHIQVNDRNRKAPGQGQDQFSPLFLSIKKINYHGIVSVEPFIYAPDRISCAARAIGYIKGILEAQDNSIIKPF